MKATNQETPAPQLTRRRGRRSLQVAAIFALLGVAAACSTRKNAEPTGAYPSPATWSEQSGARYAEGGPADASGAVLTREESPASAPHLEQAHPKSSAKAGSEGDAPFVADDEGWESDQKLVAPSPEFNSESYDSIVENRFVSTKTSPLSTFSVDVDTASYSNVRRFLTSGARPPAGAVRIEELVNYFDYQYDSPRGDAPFGVYTELSTAPWAGDHQLLHIGIQGERMELGELPPRNLVFLLDVSGSMEDPNKLPLLKQSLGALLETMGERDTVSIVVYAGASGMVLPPTSAARKREIFGAMDRLQAGGSTNGGEGIELAYAAAAKNFRSDGVNRVILATDGDFNVGVTNQSDLIDLIEKKRESGVFLTVLGFGMGNYKDSTLEKLADKGNGNYAYIDTFAEARKVLVEEGGANMVTIAKDVKIQIEMNPEFVGAYRLIGYENRALRDEDFNDDRKDAGEIGAGHTVTALYEILSPEQAAREVNVDGLRYQKPSQMVREDFHDRQGGSELATVKIRYKEPQGSRSRLIEVAVGSETRPPSRTSEMFRFSAAVASFGMLLRDSEFKGQASFRQVTSLARGAVGDDPHGHKHEFLNLVTQAARL